MGTQMKIFHFSNVIGKFGGGVSQVVQALLFYQYKLGWKPELWFLGTKAQEVELNDDINIEKHNISAIEKPLLSLPFFYKKLRQIKDENIIIHQHGVFLPISFLSLTARKKVKVIISPHGYLEPEKMKVSFLKKWLVLRLYEYKNLKKCSCLIACSIQEAKALRDFGLNQPIAILPNGVESSMVKKIQFTENRKYIRKNNSAKSNAKTLLFLSRIHPFKGLKLLLRSILSVQIEFRKYNWVFVIAGINELQHEEELKSFVHLNGLDDIVHFVGAQYGENKINILDAADCFILPSKGENFGIVIIEALARGLPVITTNTTPWQELERYGCGWCVDRSQVAFKSVLLELITTDTKDLEVMGEKGIKLVHKKYTWPKIVEQSLSIYEWVAMGCKYKSKQKFTLYETKKTKI